MAIVHLCRVLHILLLHTSPHHLYAGDVNAAFLLLHWGANVETTDLNGDTPLLWLIRNKSTVPGTTAHELIKLLLRFGASTLASNPTDGNNTLHVLVTLPKIDLKTSFLLYQAAGPTGKLAVNKNNLTPYQVRAACAVLYV